MFLRLTYNATGQSTLVNMSRVKTMYRVNDPKGLYPPSTKIEFFNVVNQDEASYLNVTEDLQTIFKLIQEHEKGLTQDTQWEDAPMPVRERFETAYINHNRKRERNYNTPHTFNENRF